MSSLNFLIDHNYQKIVLLRRPILRFGILTLPCLCNARKTVSLKTLLQNQSQKK